MSGSAPSSEVELSDVQPKKEDTDSPPGSSEAPSKPLSCGDKVEAYLHSMFSWWGGKLSYNPGLIMLIAVVMSLLGMIGLVVPGIQQVSDASKIWVPKGARALVDQVTVDNIWGASYQLEQIWVTREDGGNMLTRSAIQEMLDYDTQLRNLQVKFPDKEDTRNYRDVSRSKGFNEGRFPEEFIEWNDVCAPAPGDGFGGGDGSGSDDEEPGLACLLFNHPLEWFYFYPGMFNVSNNDIAPDCTDDQVSDGSCDVSGSRCFNNTANPKTTAKCTVLQRFNSHKGADMRMFPVTSERNLSTSALGGVEYNAAGEIISAKAIYYSYLNDKALDQEGPERAKGFRIAGWEYGFAKFSREWNATEGHKLRIYAQSSRAITDELSALIGGDVVKVNIGIFLIIIYAVLVLGKFHPVRERSVLAFAGIVSVGLSIGMSYGISTWLGFKYTPVHGVLPFILIGIGVDDMFVLVNAFDNSHKSKLDERMRDTFSEAGVSITITSFTDFFAFFLGATSSLPALENFCAFAAMGILCDYFLQISFFGAAMVWDAQRQIKKKKDCCGACCCSPKSCCCCFGRLLFAKDGETMQEEGMLKRCIRNYYVPLFASNVFRVLVLVIFIGWFGLSCYFATFLKQDFSFRWFVPSDSPLNEVFDVQDKYYNDTGLPISITTGTANGTQYEKKETQLAFLSLDKKMKASKWLKEDSTDSWYVGFTEWVEECKAIKDEVWDPEWANYTAAWCGSPAAPGTSPTPHNCRFFPAATRERLRMMGGTLKHPECEGKELQDDGTVAEENFYPWVRTFFDVNQTRAGSRYGANILWTNDPTLDEDNQAASTTRTITYTRIRATYLALSSADDEVASMVDLRVACGVKGAADKNSMWTPKKPASETEGWEGDTAPLEAIPFMFMYLYYEQYAVIIEEGIQNLALAMVAVIIITVVLLGNLGASCLVILCILMIDADILGMMYLWNISIDSVAVANLVLAIGLAVDYSVHVAHAYIGLKGDPVLRAQVAMIDMGTSVLHGGISTFVAVVVLATSNSYIFVVFFQMFFGICVFGLGHGMIFLPVCLSFLGPAPHSNAKDAETEKNRTYVTEISDMAWNTTSTTKVSDITPPNEKADPES